MTTVENCATKTNGRRHIPNFAKLEAATMTQSFKDSVKDTTFPVPQSYYRALQELNALETDTVNKSKITSSFRTLSGLKSSLYRARRQLLPQMPR